MVLYLSVCLAKKSSLLRIDLKIKGLRGSAAGTVFA